MSSQANRSPLILPTRQGYDQWAEVYDIDGNPLVMLEEPHVTRMLGDTRGLAVLDVACGTGRHTIQLANAGAKVIGVDFSEGMLAKARAKAGASGAQFMVHDIATRFPFADEAFDRVLCGLALDHVKELRPFFAELGRVCKPSGCVVASVMHPAMMLKGVQARFHDSTTGQEVRVESATHEVSDYVMAALRSGLRLVELSEHAVNEDLARKAPRAERYVGWPLLLMMKLERA